MLQRADKHNALSRVSRNPVEPFDSFADQVFRREPEEAEEEDAQPTPVFYSNEEASAFAAEVQKSCGQALNEACLALLVEAITQLEAEMPATVANFWQGAGRDKLRLKLKSLVKDDASHQLIGVAIAAAYAKSSDERLLLWCEARAVFRDYLRIESHPSKDRSDADTAYLRELSRVLASGLHRHAAACPEINALLELEQRFPNFSEPLNFLAEQAALSRLRGEHEFRVPPMLFVGAPGIGKTHLAQALASLLGSKVETIGLSSSTGGFALSGLDRGWGTARSGMIFSAIANGESLAPVIVLDEIDKVGTDMRSDPLGSLYQLLESRTAREFRDEYVEFGIDASHVAWIATANDTRPIPAPLLSRFMVFHIEVPDAAQLESIAGRIYSDLIKGVPGAPASIPESWLERLGERSLRELRNALQQALGQAALRAAKLGALELSLDETDLSLVEQECHKRKIGFIG